MNKFIVISALFAIFCIPVSAQTAKDSVTISGKVTDYDGNPLDSVSIFWQHRDFSDAHSALTDKNGNYTARITKGKYQSMGALNMAGYPITGSTWAEKDQRLEFWCWDFIADRDTVFNMQYHRMEAYGIRAFRIPGATPSLVIYVRPMSLTRYQEWIKTKNPANRLAPSPDKLEAKVYIDGQDVTILMKQEIKEYFDEKEYGNAYLLTVDLPKQKTTLPYHLLKVVLTDLENGDKGEGCYFLEKENYN